MREKLLLVVTKFEVAPFSDTREPRATLLPITWLAFCAAQTTRYPRTPRRPRQTRFAIPFHTVKVREAECTQHFSTVAVLETLLSPVAQSTQRSPQLRQFVVIARGSLARLQSHCPMCFCFARNIAPLSFRSCLIDVDIASASKVLSIFLAFPWHSSNSIRLQSRAHLDKSCATSALAVRDGKYKTEPPRMANEVQHLLKNLFCKQP